jgi:hypothetical protein
LLQGCSDHRHQRTIKFFESGTIVGILDVDEVVETTKYFGFKIDVYGPKDTITRISIQDQTDGNVGEIYIQNESDNFGKMVHFGSKTILVERR